MKNTTALEKLNKIVSKKPSGWFEEAKERERNQEWLMKSAKIAIRILSEIKSKKATQEMTQKVLAAKMGVSEQYVSKILKGQENLSLETIAKIEKAMGITLIEVPLFSEEKTQPSSHHTEFKVPDFSYPHRFTFDINFSSNMFIPPVMKFDTYSKFITKENQDLQFYSKSIQLTLQENISKIINDYKKFINLNDESFKEDELTESFESENIFA